MENFIPYAIGQIIASMLSPILIAAAILLSKRISNWFTLIACAVAFAVLDRMVWLSLGGFNSVTRSLLSTPYSVIASTILFSAFFYLARREKVEVEDSESSAAD